MFTAVALQQYVMAAAFPPPSLPQPAFSEPSREPHICMVLNTQSTNSRAGCSLRSTKPPSHSAAWCGSENHHSPLMGSIHPEQLDRQGMVTGNGFCRPVPFPVHHSSVQCRILTLLLRQAQVQRHLDLTPRIKILYRLLKVCHSSAFSPKNSFCLRAQ